MSALPSIEHLRKMTTEKVSPAGYGGFVLVRPEELDALLDAAEALETINRRISQYDDMDDATLLAWIEDESDRALARFTREES